MTTRASVQEMIATVLRSLECDILPQLAAADVAGKLRACVALLTYAEDRVQHDRDILVADAADMRSVLAAAHAAGIDLPSMAALDRIPARVQDISTTQLAEEDSSYRAALSDLVGYLSREPDRAGSPVRDVLRQTVARMQSRAQVVLRRTENVAPI